MLTAGCGSSAKYIETGGTESVVSVGEVDIQDIQTAASGMLESLLSTGALKKAQHDPAIVIIGSIVNDTGSRFSIEDLTMRMREQLVNSGQAQVLTTYGSNAEDKTAQDVLRRQAFINGVQSEAKADFSLTGRITELKRRAGNTRQTTYTFRLTLTDLTTGREVWTKTVDMTKQGSKSGVGF